jgi:hypothetical protein
MKVLFDTTIAGYSDGLLTYAEKVYPNLDKR